MSRRLIALGLLAGLVVLWGCANKSEPDPNDPNLNVNASRNTPQMGGPGGDQPASK